MLALGMPLTFDKKGSIKVIKPLAPENAESDEGEKVRAYFFIFYNFQFRCLCISLKTFENYFKNRKYNDYLLSLKLLFQYLYQVFNFTYFFSNF